jgi:lipopolysaccharide/colanic/teichoic acid biosynthesis glycosyltransferase
MSKKKTKERNAFQRFFDRVAVRTGLKVILTLLVAAFFAIKFPEGVKIACTIAETLEITINQCS